MENLVDDGDEIVAVRVLDSEQDGTSARLSQLSLRKKHARVRTPFYRPLWS